MNDIKAYDPFSLEPFEDSLRSMLRPWRGWDIKVAPQIKLDVSEHDDSYEVKAEIPGVRKEDIDVRVDGGLVTISAEVKQEKEDKEGGRVLRRERQQGYASRSFTLACPVDESKVDARYDAGVLSLKLPKKATAESKRIKVG